MTSKKEEQKADSHQETIEYGYEEEVPVLIYKSEKKIMCSAGCLDKRCANFLGGVYVCPNKHHLCGWCYFKISDMMEEEQKSKCPMCRDDNLIKDTEISDAIEKKQWFCQGFEDCLTVFLQGSDEEIEKHKRECPFVTRCPHPSCNYSTRWFEDMGDHFKREHPTIPISTDGVVSFGDCDFILVLTPYNDDCFVLVHKEPSSGIISVTGVTNQRLEHVSDDVYIAQTIPVILHSHGNKPAIRVGRKEGKDQETASASQIDELKMQYTPIDEECALFFPRLSKIHSMGIFGNLTGCPINLFIHTEDKNDIIPIEFGELWNVRLKESGNGKESKNILTACVILSQAQGGEREVDLDDIIISHPMRPRSISETSNIMGITVEEAYSAGYVSY